MQKAARFITIVALSCSSLIAATGVTLSAAAPVAVVADGGTGGSTGGTGAAAADPTTPPTTPRPTPPGNQPDTWGWG
ncbi:hypothetical protein ACIQGZ_29375 [Streptomyces sp. NPDC092296]|uniref:hypothetical protein n=1 Tax=Streptomyces sp. NPDC092296 TaxID=3366012 RepID=UPI00380A4A74